MSANGEGRAPESARAKFRTARSKDGCLTCKRRKVKCDEQRPRCAHCERLNMECRWQPHYFMAPPQTSPSVGRRRRKESSSSGVGAGITAGQQATTPTLATATATMTTATVPMSLENEDINNHNQATNQPVQTTPTQAHIPSQTPQAAVNRVFDYASFLWDDMPADSWMPTNTADLVPSFGFDASVMESQYGGMGQQQQQQHAAAAVPPMGFSTAAPMHSSPSHSTSTHMATASGGEMDLGSTEAMSIAAAGSSSAFTAAAANHSNNTTHMAAATMPHAVPQPSDLPMQMSADNHKLMDYFIHAVTPPILAEVETSKKWFAVRQVLVAMASASRMVRWAILAFSEVLLCRRDGAWMASRQNHYRNALAEVEAHCGGGSGGNVGDGDGDGDDTAGCDESGGGGRKHKNKPEDDEQRNLDNTGYPSSSTTGNKKRRHQPQNSNTNDPSSRHLARHSPLRENLLATLFFLSYVDILEGRIEAAHSNLKRAFGIFRGGERGSFRPLERQFLLWTRLLDGRAVSAGGEGLFLSKDDEAVLVVADMRQDGAGAEGSRAGGVSGGGSGGDGAAGDAGIMAAGGSEPSPLATALISGISGDGDDDMEDVLFQVLYQPGITFFQKVQSFTGRISKIDPWHRPRGTVEDETEVLNIGAAIAADLRKLYESRPLLMDHAVAGRLTAPHVSAGLAFTLTRAFRTYLSNYYACQIHLHRVAYKSFPLTREATTAIRETRRLARLLVEGLDAFDEDALPVNMLWPLLMLGSEETDAGEREWIRAQILRMEKVAGNARITAQVLEEVQRRQDGKGARVDIRSVMHAIFDSCFAIV